MIGKGLRTTHKVVGNNSVSIVDLQTNQRFVNEHYSTTRTPWARNFQPVCSNKALHSGKARRLNPTLDPGFDVLCGFCGGIPRPGVIDWDSVFIFVFVFFLCLYFLSLPVVFELGWMRRILFYLQHSHIWVTGAAPGNNICVWSPFFVLFIVKWCLRWSFCDFVTKPVHWKKSSGSLDVEHQPNVRCSGHLRVWFLWSLMKTFRILKMTWLCEITSFENCFCHFYWRITCVNS